MGWFWVEGENPMGSRPLAHDPNRDRKLAALAWFSVPLTGALGPCVLWLIARKDPGLATTRRHGAMALWASTLLYLGWVIYVAPKFLDRRQTQDGFDATFLAAIVVWLVVAAAAGLLGVIAYRRAAHPDALHPPAS